MKEKILKQYDEVKYIFDSLGDKIKDILSVILSDNNINIHQISNRLKNKDSLSKKIDSRNNKYTDISEITDICGLRIITYLESDVTKIANIIEKEFTVDLINSIDKRKLQADQFGYRSLHFVVSLDENRIKPTENKKYSGLKVEIQIRSILQHAWAEIEHDLGYKNKISIPEDLRRNFNRISALLETADIEFDRLKHELSNYEKTIEGKIKEKPDIVELNQASLISFLHTNETFNTAREIIRKNVGCEFREIGNLQGELERFELFKIETIGDLEKLIEKHKTHYLLFVELFTEHIQEKYLYFSIPLFYFQHFLVASKMDINYLEEYYNYGTRKIGDDGTSRDFFEVYKESEENMKALHITRLQKNSTMTHNK